MPNAAFDGTFDGWRSAARAALGAGLAPADVVWQSANDVQHGLALDAAPGHVLAPDLPPGRAPMVAAQASVPRRFLAIGALVACHRDTERWATLYRVLWRLTRGGEPHLLAVAVDPDVLHLTRMTKAIRREVHKMHAFVRFRRVLAADGTDEYIAWFEPEHDVVEQAAALFVRRFANMRWAVLTPRTSVRWNGTALSVGPGVPRQDAPSADALEQLWGTYYAHIFNPARVKLDAMRAEMPKKYWRNLPEAPLIGPMVRDAPGRVRRMVEAAARPRSIRDVAVPSDAPDVRGVTLRSAGTLPGVRPRAAPPERMGDALVYHGSAAWERDAGGAGEPSGVVANAAERMRQYAAHHPLAVAESTRDRVFSPVLAALWAERAPAGLVFDVYAHSAMVGGGIRPHHLPRAIRDLLPPSLAGAERVDGALVPDALREALWVRFTAAVTVLAGRGLLGAVLVRLPRTFAPGRETAGHLRRWVAALEAWNVGVEFGDPQWDAPRLRPRTTDLLGHAVVVRDPDRVHVIEPAELTIVRAGARDVIERAAEQSRTVHVLG